MMDIEIPEYEEDIKRRYWKSEVHDLTPWKRNYKLYGVMISPFVYLETTKHGTPKRPYRVILKLTNNQFRTLPFSRYIQEAAMCKMFCGKR